MRSESAADDPLRSRWVSIDLEEGPARSGPRMASKVNEGSVFGPGDASTTAGLRSRNTSTSSPGLEGGEGVEVGAVV